MHITVDRKQLHTALGVVGRVVWKGSTMAILESVRLTASDGSLDLAATNLDLTLVTRIPARVTTPGVAAVPSKGLGAYVASASADELALKVDSKDRLEILADKSRSEIRGYAADDFPAVNLAVTVGPVHLAAGGLHDALAGVTFAAAKDQVRPTLSGVHFEVKGGQLHLAAADGFRVAWKALPVTDSTDSAGFAAIVPLKSAVELARLIAGADDKADVTFGLGGQEGATPSRAVFTVGETTLVTRLIEGTFPNWRQIVPTSSAVNLSVDRRALLQAVGRARIFADSKEGIIRLEIERTSEPLGLIRVSAKGDLGSSVDEVGCTLHGDGLRIAFNGAYLEEALSAIGTDALRLELSSSSRPGVFRPAGYEDHLVVCMQMNEKSAAKVAATAATAAA